MFYVLSPLLSPPISVFRKMLQEPVHQLFEGGTTGSKTKKTSWDWTPHPGEVRRRPGHVICMKLDFLFKRNFLIFAYSKNGPQMPDFDVLSINNVAVKLSGN